MENNSTVFDDIMQGLNEVEEYQKGNINLKSNIVEIADDGIGDIYNQLTDNDKYFVKRIINGLLISNSN